jgi:hypothetical protein
VVSLSKRLTPEMKAFIQHWEGKGDVKEYLTALSTDYSKMPAEDVMRHQLRQDYPRATEAQLNVLFKREVIDAYKLDTERFDPEEVEEGRMLLEAKADRYRDTFAENQKKFLLPPPPEPQDEPVDNTEVLRQQKVEAYQSQIKESSYTKNILAQNKITLGEGEEAFNFPVNGNEVVGILTDDQQWAAAMFDISKDANGNTLYNPKVEHQALVATVAKHGMGFIKELAKHYKAIGAKALTDQIENVKPPDGSTASATEIAPNSAAAAMAKHGRIV